MAGFAEVIYSQDRKYHRSLGSSNHVHLGFPQGWSRAQVAAFGRKITGLFPGTKILGQCRANNVRPPGGAANSLHYVRNGCRALDIDTVYPSGSAREDRILLELEAWARAQSGLTQTTDVAFTNAGGDIAGLLREVGLGVAAFTGGIVCIGLGIYMIARDNGAPSITSLAVGAATKGKVKV